MERIHDFPIHIVVDARRALNLNAIDVAGYCWQLFLLFTLILNYL